MCFLANPGGGFMAGKKNFESAEYFERFLGSL
jgi:hypothetical protein